LQKTHKHSWQNIHNLSSLFPLKNDLFLSVFANIFYCVPTQTILRCNRFRVFSLCRNRSRINTRPNRVLGIYLSRNIYICDMEFDCHFSIAIFACIYIRIFIRWFYSIMRQNDKLFASRYIGHSPMNRPRICFYKNLKRFQNMDFLIFIFRGNKFTHRQKSAITRIF
jgi:hypothetical protein